MQRKKQEKQEKKEETEEEKEKNYGFQPHTNHRQRLKNRFLKEGLDFFDSHLILELLLFYSIPRRDTNETAHRLLNEFGSLSGVFDANYEDLINCCGIGESSALLIKMIPQYARAYMLDKSKGYPSFCQLDKIGEYLINYFIGAICEKIVVLLFNNNMELIDSIQLTEGSVSSANFPIRSLNDCLVRRNAACFIVAHNHPSGNLEPSQDDIATTKVLLKTFNDGLGIPMIDHIIVAEGRYNPIIRSTGIAKRQTS